MTAEGESPLCPGPGPSCSLRCWGGGEAGGWWWEGGGWIGGCTPCRKRSGTETPHLGFLGRNVKGGREGDNLVVGC